MPPTNDFDRDSLWAYLLWLRNDLGVELDTVNQKLCELIPSESSNPQSSAEAFFGQYDGKKVTGCNIRKIRGQRRLSQLSANDFRCLANAIDGQRGELLVAPMLFSSITDEQSCHLAFDRFEPVPRGPSDFGSRGMKYEVPNRRLDSSNTSFVLDTIPPGESSAFHSHPGDELMVFLEGSAIVRFKNNAVWTQVWAGSLCHFNAEQPHQLVNIARDTCRVLIIRFYQKEGPEVIPSARRRLIHDAESCLRPSRGSRQSSLDPTAKDLIRRMVSELRGSVSGARRQDDEIQDRLGLARLVQQLAKVEDISFRQLEDRVKDDSGDQENAAPSKRTRTYNQAFFHRLHHADVPIRREDFPVLAKAYKVPAMLFWNFLFPADPNTIFIRGHLDFEALSGGGTVAPLEPSSCFDFEKMEEYEEISEADPTSHPLPSGTQYWIPRRRLLDSDVAIVFVQLQPGATTNTNAHPGSEIIFPLSDGLNVCFDELQPIELSVACEQLAHFKSINRHYVKNVGDDVARFIAIRFYEAETA